MSESVTSTIGRLQRFFPGPAIAIDQLRIDDVHFRTALIQCISQLDSKTLEQACPTSRKAQANVVEVRETVSPMFVTEMLTGILRGIGEPHNTTYICKKTRDEVLWHNARVPWRRSPRWLLLRVALQSSLMDAEAEKQDHTQYKYFVILLLTRILNLAVKKSEDSEILFIMIAKISRRMLKLGHVGNQMCWLENVKESILTAQNLISSRWDIIQQNRDPVSCNQHPDFASLVQGIHTVLSLSSFKEHLETAAERNTISSDAPRGLQPCPRRIKQCALELPSVTGKNHLLHFIDIEIWVRNHLQEWTKKQIETLSRSSCEEISLLFRQYLKGAKEWYKDDPENVSMMVLTLLDLWKSLDQLAILQEPLLAQYDTGFPWSLFDSLLLPQKVDMLRLHLVEQHLAVRRRDAQEHYPSIFTSAHESNSFAVRYYEQSDVHQELKQDIETAASNERERKRNELNEKKAKVCNVCLKTFSSISNNY